MNILTKQCTKCNEIKPATTEYFHATKTGKYGIESRCKECSKKYHQQNREKRNKRLREYYQCNKERTKERTLMREYNLTMVEYKLMLKRQNNRCKICKRKFTKKLIPYVDHNHVSDVVRGILCYSCNIILGYSRGSISRLQGCINYMKKYGIDYSLSSQQTLGDKNNE